MNISMLRWKITEKRMNIETTAKRINISRSALYRKLQKPHSFTIGEVIRLKNVLELTNEEAIDIFLS